MFLESKIRKRIYNMNIGLIAFGPDPIFPNPNRLLLRSEADNVITA